MKTSMKMKRMPNRDDEISPAMARIEAIGKSIFFAISFAHAYQMVSAWIIGDFAGPKIIAESFIRLSKCSKYSVTPELKGLKGIGDNYFLETYTGFRQRSINQSSRNDQLDM